MAIKLTEEDITKIILVMGSPPHMGSPANYAEDYEMFRVHWQWMREAVELVCEMKGLDADIQTDYAKVADCVTRLREDLVRAGLIQEGVYHEPMSVTGDSNE
jgi:hypothetical protein